MPALLAFLFFLLPGVAPAQPAQQSTAAPAAVQSPLTLNITKEPSYSRIGLDYSLRWDFSDLAGFRPRLGLITEGVKALTSWDITQNTRLNYYGLKTNPWKLIISSERKPPPSPAAGGEGVVSAGPQPEYRKRLRLSVSPLVDDFKRSFDDGLKDFLLRSSLKELSPEWQRAGRTGQKAFMKDVLSIGIWDSGIPVVKETGEGLQYISK